MASAGLAVALFLIGLAAAGWWSSATLREYNRRLEVQIDRADGHAREAEERALKDRRNAAAARLGRASQAFNDGQLERAQEILHDLAKDSPGESLFPFAWRLLQQQAHAELEFLVGPVPRLAGMARSPDGTKLATSEEFDGLQLWSGGVPRQLDESKGVAGWLGAPAYSPDGRLIAVPGRTPAAARSG